MLEGIQQTYPGVTGQYPSPMIPQTGFNAPLGGVIGSGVQGLFGNPGIGRTLDPVTQSYLQQVQLAQQLGPQAGGLFGNQLGNQQWGGQTGRVPLDPITTAHLQHIIQQIAQLLVPQASFGNPTVTNPLLANHPLANQMMGGIPGSPLQTLGQIGRPYGLDPVTLAVLQQIQAQQLQQIPQMGFGGQHLGSQFGGQFGGGSPFGGSQFGGSPFGGSPFGRLPFQSNIGASPYGVW